MAFRTEILRYNLLKSKNVILMRVCGRQFLNARLARWMVVSVSRHIVFTVKVRLGYFARRLKYNSFNTLFIT
jgi:hypothetical protein